MKKAFALIPFHALAVSSATLLVAASAPAAGPFPAGTFALGAERMTGFYHASSSEANVDTSINRITFLGQDTAGRAYDLPRIGIDGFVIDGLSLGGTLMVSHTSTDSRAPAPFIGNVGVSTSTTDFLIAPRVGYATMFSEHVGIWPRGGFSYFHDSKDFNGGGTDSTHFITLGFEVPFLFALVPNFAITAGPTFDIALEGTHTATAANGRQQFSNDISYTAFGLAVGLVGWL